MSRQANCHRTQFLKNFQGLRDRPMFPGSVQERQFSVKSGIGRNNIFAAERGLRFGICVESQALGLRDFGGAAKAKMTSSESSPHFKDSTVAAPKSTL
jgi:hypothetical protein